MWYEEVGDVPGDPGVSGVGWCRGCAIREGALFARTGSCGVSSVSLGGRGGGLLVWGVLSGEKYVDIRTNRDCLRPSTRQTNRRQVGVRTTHSAWTAARTVDVCRGGWVSWCGIYAGETPHSH